jgi:hypothetical protein
MARRLILALVAVAVMVGVSGCQGSIDEVVGGFNARATQIAGGQVGGAAPTATPQPGPTAGPTSVPTGFHDLTTDPNALLVQAWGQTTGLPSGSQFQITADQYQVGQYIIQVLQSDRRSQTAVRGGSLAIDLGQIRLDMALEDTSGQFGSGTITFQPTLDEAARIRLNPQGANFNGLRMPDEFTAALGDAMLTVLTGAPTEDLRRVNLSEISLSGGRMRVSGTIR